MSISQIEKQGYNCKISPLFNEICSTCMTPDKSYSNSFNEIEFIRNKYDILSFAIWNEKTYFLMIKFYYLINDWQI